MDQVFINILMKSELSDEFKANLLHLLKDYYDSAYGHISVGDAYDLVKDLLILESDLKNSSFNDETIRSFIYVYAKKCCYKTMRDK
ncbi:MAG: hypothetical protein PHF21_03035, partial [Bacilli bacterium]|nr:hypothetical protein [Bacilli bacterium]